MRFLAFLFSLLTLSGAVLANKPVLVLFPVEVVGVDSQQADADSSTYGNALQQGLSSRYTVFYGPAVEKELEKEYEKIDCDAERCAQNIAIAFNGELIGDASVRKLVGGYVLELQVRNIFSGEIVESRSENCEGCSQFAVIDKLKLIGNGKKTATSAQEQVDAAALLKALNEFKNGNNAAQPASGANTLQQEANMWFAIRESDEKSDFETFLEAFPIGKYAEEARKKVVWFEHIEAEALFNVARYSGDINRLEAILTQYPNWVRNGEVRQEIAALKQQNEAKAIWQNIRKSPSRNTIETFLQMHPYSQYASEAKKILQYKKIASDGSELPLDASEWACVLDTETGLLWEVKTPSNQKQVFFYKEARKTPVKQAKKAKMCGRKDWRLPNYTELKTILYEAGKSVTADVSSVRSRGTKQVKSQVRTDLILFPYTNNYYYWSATDYNGYRNSRRIVDFGYNHDDDEDLWLRAGDKPAFGAEDKKFQLNVRLVAGEEMRDQFHWKVER